MRTVMGLAARAVGRGTGWCLAPYAAWVAFASLLNAAFFVLN